MRRYENQILRVTQLGVLALLLTPGLFSLAQLIAGVVFGQLWAFNTDVLFEGRNHGRGFTVQVLANAVRGLVRGDLMFPVARDWDSALFLWAAACYAAVTAFEAVLLVSSVVVSRRQRRKLSDAIGRRLALDAAVRRPREG